MKRGQFTTYTLERLSKKYTRSYDTDDDRDLDASDFPQRRVYYLAG